MQPNAVAEARTPAPPQDAPSSCAPRWIRREDDAFWATVEEFPGVFATGDTLEELHASLSEGVALYLAAPGEPAPDVSISPLVEASTRVELAYA